jgi:hypothetical protein
MLVVVRAGVEWSGVGWCAANNHVLPRRLNTAKSVPLLRNGIPNILTTDSLHSCAVTLLYCTVSASSV